MVHSSSPQNAAAAISNFAISTFGIAMSAAQAQQNSIICGQHQHGPELKKSIPKKTVLHPNIKSASFLFPYCSNHPEMVKGRINQLPSRQLTYPLEMAFWRWFSFSQGGMLISWRVYVSTKKIPFKTNLPQKFRQKNGAKLLGFYQQTEALWEMSEYVTLAAPRRRTVGMWDTPSPDVKLVRNTLRKNTVFGQYITFHNFSAGFFIFFILRHNSLGFHHH